MKRFLLFDAGADLFVNSSGIFGAKHNERSIISLRSNSRVGNHSHLDLATQGVNSQGLARLTYLWKSLMGTA